MNRLNCCSLSVVIGGIKILNVVAVAVFAASTVTSMSVAAVEVIDLDGRWFLHKDGEMKSVTVPHDWAIAGPFDPAGDEHTAKLPWKGAGTYERTFVVDGNVAKMLSDGGEAYLEVDGAMASPRVKVNGHDVGGWNYGYMSFSIPVAKSLRTGENAVSISCDTSKHKSRWYPGGGLYRSVRLKVVPKNHVLPGTMFIRAVHIGLSSATVRAEYELSQGGRKTEEFEVKNPIFWSVDNPHLYEFTVAGESFRYGIRTIEFTSEDGFHLNGKRLQLKGVCLHSDLGTLGMAFSVDAARRQLAIMKDMGVNAIRTSHNPPAPQFLDLCDDMGFVVWNECFDKWDGTSGRSEDENLEDYVSVNLRQFVRRDRNHPCVAIWSIGNEMPPKSAENPHGVTRARCKLFRDAIRELDPTRPVGVGGCLDYASTVPDFVDLDVSGWNYRRCYMVSRKENPKQPLVYSESCSCFSTAGHYRFPLPTGRTEWGISAREESSYDMTAPGYGDIPDVEFNRMEKDTFVGGEFVWTGFDYLGEPSPYVRGLSEFRGWGLTDREIARSSYYGIVGLDGIPKDRYWLYRSHWNPVMPTAHLVPHNWNYSKGMKIPTVMAYTSGVEGELFLNGRSLGRKRKVLDVEGYSLDHPKENYDRDSAWRKNPYYRIVEKYRLVWDDVNYEPGVLEVVCYDESGLEVARDRVETSGEPVRAVVTPDPYSRPEDCIRFFRIHASDARGVRVPDAVNLVRFKLDGDGEIVAVGNADPHGHRSFVDVSAHPLFAGSAVVVVRAEPRAKYKVIAELEK